MARKVELTQAILDDIIRRVVEVAQPVQIILFGSAAHGEMTSDSDVDLLVVKEAQINRREHEENIYRNFFGLTIPVDVIVVTIEEKYRDKEDRSFQVPFHFAILRPMQPLPLLIIILAVRPMKSTFLDKLQRATRRIAHRTRSDLLLVFPAL